MHDATCVKSSVHCHDSCAYSAHNSLAIACWPDSSGALDVTLDKQIFRPSSSALFSKHKPQSAQARKQFVAYRRHSRSKCSVLRYSFKCYIQCPNNCLANILAMLHDSSPLVLYKSDLQLESCKNRLAYIHYILSSQLPYQEPKPKIKNPSSYIFMGFSL